MKDRIFKNLIYLFTICSISILFILIFFLYGQSMPFFRDKNLISFIFDNNWNATEGFENFGILNILGASILVTLISCIISLPFAYGSSIFIVFYAKESKLFIKWLIGILAGIPSIIYGFFGLFFVVKIIEKSFKVSTGESLLAGAIILSIMIFPYFVSNIVESMEIIKGKFKRDSDSLCVSKEFFIRKIVFRESLFSVFTGFILAFSRAIGETMAVMMVIGNTPLFPKLFSKVQTIPSLIALEIGMSEVGSKHYYALFASGFLLLLLVLIINIILFILNNRRREYE